MVKKRQRRPALHVCVVVSDKTAASPRTHSRHDARNDVAARRSVVAFALAHVVVSPRWSSTSSLVQQRLRDLALERSKRAIVEVFLECKIEALCRLERPSALPDDELEALGLLELFGNQPGASRRVQVCGGVAKREKYAEQMFVHTPAPVELPRCDFRRGA